MSWSVQVEPPQDMDEAEYDIDPRMILWQHVTGTRQDRQPLKAEEDLDVLYHSSMSDLLQNINTYPATDIQSDTLQEDTNTRYDHREENDIDDIAHSFSGKMAPGKPNQDWDEMRKVLEGYLAPSVAKSNTGTGVHKAHTEPEGDEDDMYHKDSNSPVQIEKLQHEAREETVVMIHLQPEEDMDDLYHEDLQLIPYHGDADAAMPVLRPSLRICNEPEEDLDALHHQWPLINNWLSVNSYHAKSKTDITDIPHVVVTG